MSLLESMAINCSAVSDKKRPLTHILIMSAVSPGLLQNLGISWVKSRYPFLPKPFPKDTLPRKVQEALKGPLPTNPPKM